MRSKIISIEMSQLKHIVNGCHRGLLIGKWELGTESVVLPIGYCVVDGTIMPPGIDIPQARLKRFAFYPQNSVDVLKADVAVRTDSKFQECFTVDCDLIVGTDYTVNYVLGRYHDLFESSRPSHDENTEQLVQKLDQLINYFDDQSIHQIRRSLREMRELIK